MNKLVMGALLALSTTAYAHAQEAAQSVAGVMTVSCKNLTGKFSEGDGLSNPLAFAMLSWTEGYISATNLTLAGENRPIADLGAVTRTELWASIYGFCKRNPDELGVVAAIEAMKTLPRVTLD